MTTAIYLKVGGDCRVETERFLRTFDSQTGVSRRLDETVYPVHMHRAVLTVGGT